MSRRAAAAAQTRSRIVQAARALHAERGIAATSWDDIAARAGVGVGTVYRHFPSLDELIPACGDVAMEAIALPDRPAIDRLFADAPTAAERLRRLVAEAFGIYERGAPELRALRREAGVHPRLAQDRDRLDEMQAALVEAALAPLPVTEDDRALVRALVDLGTWDALRDHGLDGDAAVAAISDVLAQRLAAPGAQDA